VAQHLSVDVSACGIAAEFIHQPKDAFPEEWGIASGRTAIKVIRQNLLLVEAVIPRDSRLESFSCPSWSLPDSLRILLFDRGAACGRCHSNR
jgi:hypothetical protein